MYYKINDGRIWDVKAAKFIHNLPADTSEKEIIPLWCDGHQGDVNYLKRTLAFYGYTIGDELKTDEELAEDVRIKRNKLLSETDYLVLPDSPISDNYRQSIMIYRKRLRDITEQSGFPKNIDWPIKPEKWD